MMRAMNPRLSPLLLVALATFACSDAKAPPAEVAPADKGAPVLDDVTDAPQGTPASDAAAKPLPMPVPTPTGEAAALTDRIGELSRLLGKVNDAKTAAEAKPRLDELVAEFGNLKSSLGNLAVPPNVTKRLERLLENVEVERVVGETLRQLQNALR